MVRTRAMLTVRATVTPQTSTQPCSASATQSPELHAALPLPQQLSTDERQRQRRRHSSNVEPQLQQQEQPQQEPGLQAAWPGQGQQGAAAITEPPQAQRMHQQAALAHPTWSQVQACTPLHRWHVFACPYSTCACTINSQFLSDAATIATCRARAAFVAGAAAKQPAASLGTTCGPWCHEWHARLGLYVGTDPSTRCAQQPVGHREQRSSHERDAGQQQQQQQQQPPPKERRHRRDGLRVSPAAVATVSAPARRTRQCVRLRGRFTAVC